MSERLPLWIWLYNVDDISTLKATVLCECICLHYTKGCLILLCKKNNPLANTWKLKALAFYWTSMGASPLTIVKPWEFHLSNQLFTAVLALFLLDLMLKFWCLHQKIQTYESMQYLTAFVRGFHTSSDLMVQLTQVIERFSVVIKVQISLVCMNK